MAKIGILISIAPDDLQDTILQHADRLKEYKRVKDKMVGCLMPGRDSKTPTLGTSALLARTIGGGMTPSRAMLMWLPLEKETIALDAVEWATSPTGARLPRARAREKTTRGSIRKAGKGREIVAEAKVSTKV